MEEIKFRAWIPRSHFMGVPFNLLQKLNQRLGEFEDDTIFMQYTGLRDKNGKEAYHKDILKDFILGELWVIEWSDEYAGFELQRITRNTIRAGGILEKLSACRIVDLGEIIGNIYENPELEVA